MKHFNLKKFLTLLVCMMLVASLFLFAACNNDTDDETESTTYTPSFTNGNFTTSSSTTDGYPYTPSSWTRYPSSDLNYIFIENTISGLISLESSAYASNKSKWGDLAHFSPNTDGLDENYTNDQNVLMIYNTEPSYAMYRSATFTAAARNYYKLSVDVRTAALEGGALRGATILLHNSSSNLGVAEYDSVVSDNVWTRYTFYVKTGTSSSSLQLWLMLGKNIDSDTSEYLTSGYAFFDNVTFEALENGNDDYVAAQKSATVQKIDVSIPNPEFNYSSGTSNINRAPAFYSTLGTSNASYGRLEIGAGFAASTEALFGESHGLTDPGYAHAVDPADINALYPYIYSAGVTDGYAGFYTSSALSFTRGAAFKISLYINTAAMTSGNAYLALSSDRTLSGDENIQLEITGATGWTQYNLYVVANQNTALSLYLHFGVGTSTSVATGTAFFDSLSVEEIDLGDVPSDDTLVLDATDAVSDNMIADGYFINTAATAWQAVYDDGTSNVVDGVITDFTHSVIAIDPSEEDNTYTIPYSVRDGGTTYSNILRVSSPTGTPSIYKLKNDNNGAFYKLAPNTAYRFSVWVKTEDVQSTAGVVLNVFQRDAATALGTFASVNTGSMTATDGLNGYRELSYYFFTDIDEVDVYFELSFGSGTQWTSTTHLDGTAYIANVSLVKTTYAKFTSASSSGTYEKKYNFTTSASSSVTNGQFDTYDYTETEGLNSNGIVDGVLSDNFGVPSGWDVVKEDSVEDLDGIFTGIVDINRQDLLTNLRDAAQAQNIGLDFNNLFFTYSGANLALYDYIGEHSALMVASKNHVTEVKDGETVTTPGLGEGVNFVSAGYTNSSTISLSANTYYEISVLVKTMDNTRASVYLLCDSDSSENIGAAKFESITSTGDSVDGVDTNGWSKYTFRIKVGFSSVSVQLGLYLGQSANTSDELAPDAETGGVVFFDRVTRKTIDEDAWSADISGNNQIMQVALDVDSFGLVSSTGGNENAFFSPTSGTWTLTSSVTDDDSRQGIITKELIETHYSELSSIFAPNTGNSALAFYNAAPGAKYYTNSAKTFAANSYYRISVMAKTHSLSADGSAFIRLNVTNYTGADEGESTIYINTNDSDVYQEFVFYIKTPETDVLSSAVRLVLGLGESGDDEKLVSGYAVFDDVRIALVDEEEYTNAVEAENSLHKLVYNDIDDTQVTPEDNDTTDDDDSGADNYRWVIFTSVAFGAIIVILVIVYFIKRYLPKRKERKLADVDKVKEQQKEDKYKDLND